MIAISPQQHPLPHEAQQIREKILERLSQCQAAGNPVSLRHLARQIGINPGSLSYYLKGERSLHLQMLLQLMETLGFTPDEMLHLTLVSRGAYLADLILSNTQHPEVLPEIATQVTDFQTQLSGLLTRIPLTDACRMALRILPVTAVH